MRVSIFRQRNDVRVTAACARGGVRFRVPRIACWFEGRDDRLSLVVCRKGREVGAALVQLRFERGCSQPFYHGRSSAAGRFWMVECEMPCGTVWSGWIGFGSVRSAMSMRILNVGGSAGQPPLVFLTRMPGIRAAHPLFFPFSPSHHNSQAFLPPSSSYRFPPYRSRVSSCSTIDRLLHVYVSPFSLSSIGNPLPSPFPRIILFFSCPWSIIPSIFFWRFFVSRAR